VAWDATVKKIAQCKADGCAVVSRVGAIVGAMVGAMVGNGVQLDQSSNGQQGK